MGGLQAKGESSFLMVGLDGAGKTAILNAMSGGDSMETKPTEGHTVRSITLDGHRIKIRDVSGARAMRSYWPRYYEKADALVGCVWRLNTCRCVWVAWSEAWE
jgi:GTPase SAR1 family protein